VDRSLAGAGEEGFCYSDVFGPVTHFDCYALAGNLEIEVQVAPDPPKSSGAGSLSQAEVDQAMKQFLVTARDLMNDYLEDA
jgi:hypothetical protein